MSDFQEITSVGKLKAVIADYPDETEIWSQAVAEDGTAWMLFSKMGEIPQSHPPKLAIVMRHPELKTLPKSDAG